MIRLMPLIAGAIVLVLIIGYAIFQAVQPEPGRKTADDGQGHFTAHVPISQTTFKPYTSDPPTSGPHWDIWYTKGVYQEATDERLVHSLEHGYVIIHHNCSDVECPDLYDKLKSVFFKYDKKVILNYRPKTEAKIALVAWARMDTMEEFDEARIRRFIDAYLEKGPERGAP